MQILVSRAGQQYGPYSEGEVRDYVQSGRLSATDLAWCEGRPTWVPLSELVPLGTPPPTPAPPSLVKQPQAPPLFPSQQSFQPIQSLQPAQPFQPIQSLQPAQPFQPNVTDGAVALYNPNASANWCLLFSPAFGAFMHARNWRALGDPGRARTNLIWAGAAIAVILFFFFVPANLGVSSTVGIGLLLGWYFSQAKAQIDLVKNSFPNGYQKKSLVVPVVVATVILGVYLAIAVVVALGALLSPEKLAQNYAETIKPSILDEWHKNPAIKSSAIRSLALSPVNGSRTEFTGEVEATINGESVRLPVEVTADPTTGGVRWKVIPVNR